MNIPRYIHQITVEAEGYPGFWVDIVLDTKEEKYDMWLYHERIGVKSYMIGLLVHHRYYEEQITETLASILEYVDYHVDETIPLYVEEYMPEYELYEEDEDEE